MLESVPNFSEGRDAATIDAIATSFAGKTPPPVVHIPVGTFTRDGAAAH